MKNTLFLALAFMLASCAAGPSPATAVPFDPFGYGVDASVQCDPVIYPNIPTPQKSDIGYSFKKGVRRMTANDDNRPGLYMNAIMDLPWQQTPAVYTVTGEFRIPPGAKNETMEINVQWVEGGIEHYSELIWTLNPNRTDPSNPPVYGQIWTRNTLDGTIIPLFIVTPDNMWHSFQITSNHVTHHTEYISVDGQNSGPLNIPMGTVAKDWDHSFKFLFETTNMYTGCTPLNTFVGKSEWRNISISSVSD